MVTGKQPHILNASSNLLGICFVLVTGLKLTGVADRTYADEIAMAAAFCLLGGCLFSYVSLRSNTYCRGFERAADYLFLTGMILLFIGVVVFWRGLM